MPASNESHLGQFVPGFDFLQGLARNASSALPGLGQWIAPTLNPEEIEKRISELRTVQFWLEQNARLLATTIQALEVQRMTLATLKSMNVPVATLHESLRARTGDEAGSAPPRQRPPTPGDAAAGVVDPMQWWGALTQQFTDLAATAMQDALKEGNKVRTKPTGTGAGPHKASASRDDEPVTRRPTAAEAEATPDSKATERAARRRERSSEPPTR